MKVRKLDLRKGLQNLVPQLGLANVTSPPMA